MEPESQVDEYPDYPDPVGDPSHPYPALQRNDRLLTTTTTLPRSSSDNLPDVRTAALAFFNDFGPPSEAVPASTDPDLQNLVEGDSLEFQTDLEDENDDEGETVLHGSRAARDIGPDTRARKRGWRQFLKGTGFERLGKDERAGQPRKKRRRRKNNVDPGREFKEALSKASQEFMAGKYEAAADFARIAIEENPEVFAAHSLLSEILKAQGKEDDSLKVLTWGAHVAKSPQVWLNILERIVDMVEDDSRDDLIPEALDCAKEALKLKAVLDKDTEYVILVHRQHLLKRIGETFAARRSAKHILKRWPGDIRMCREFAEMSIQSRDREDMELAKGYYEEALALKKEQSTIDDEDDPWRHVLAYADIISTLQSPDSAIVLIKDLARWILGRKHESFWLDYAGADDREFDVGNERRNLVNEFQQGHASRDPAKYGHGLPVEVRVKLGLLRMRKGFLDHSEALRHFSHLLQHEDSIEFYYDLFLQIVRCLKDCGRNKDAEQYYDALHDVPDVLEEDIWMHMGLCYEAVGRQEDAVECFEAVQSFRGSFYGWASARLAKWYEDEGDLEKSRSLCDMVIALGKRDLLNDAQLKNVPPVPLRLQRTFDAGNQDPLQMDSSTSSKRRRGRLLPADVEGTSVPESQIAGSQDEEADMPKKTSRRPRRGGPKPPPTKTRRKTTVAGDERIRNFRDARGRIHAHFSIIELHWPEMKSCENSEAVEQWLEAAHQLLDEFMAMRMFFPERDKTMQLMVSKKEDGLFTKLPTSQPNPNAPSEFQGISFHEWHRVFVELALCHAQHGEQAECLEIIQDCILQANVFWQQPDLERIGYAAAICVGIIFNDTQFLVNIGRKLISHSDARSPLAFQIFSAINRFTYANSDFTSGPLQKFMLRLIKQSDFLAMPEALRDKYDFATHVKSLELRRERYKNEDHDINAQAIMIYGYISAIGNHHFSALPYYYRVLAHDQDNVSVNLNIATMWIQVSMKRQTHNRHFGVTQGLAYLYRYYELRVADGRACHVQEAEYNVARMWHFLGLMHLAQPAYEKVLALSAHVQQERFEDDDPASFDEHVEIEDFAKEAAFALQGMYATMGNDEAAKAITEEWLCI